MVSHGRSCCFLLIFSCCYCFCVIIAAAEVVIDVYFVGLTLTCILFLIISVVTFLYFQNWDLCVVVLYFLLLLLLKNQRGDLRCYSQLYAPELLLMVLKGACGAGDRIRAFSMYIMYYKPGIEVLMQKVLSLKNLYTRVLLVSCYSESSV